jgi:hypothetical protein
MISRRQRWPLVIFLSGALLATLVAADVQSPVRVVLTLWFLLVCTGMAFVPLLSIERPLTELGLGVIASIAVDSVVTTAILLAGDLSAVTGLVALQALCLLGCAAQIAGAPTLAPLGRTRVTPRIRLPGGQIGPAPVTPGFVAHDAPLSLRHESAGQRERPFAAARRMALGGVLAISAALAMTPDLDISSPRHDEYQGIRFPAQATGRPLALERHLAQRANDSANIQRQGRGGQAAGTPRAGGGVVGDRVRAPRPRADIAPGVGTWHGEGSRSTHDGAAPGQQTPLPQAGGVTRPPAPGAPLSTSSLPALIGKPGDRDGDGVPNSEDRCPNKPGTDSGCPVNPPANPVPGDQTPRDRDGDGVPNSEDRCPNKPGTDSGCPINP